MKSILLKAGLLTCFILLGLSYEQASAEMVWPSKCASYGEVKPNQNPTPQHINCLLTNAALDAKIPPEVVKAVATQESGWRQFDENGQPFISPDGGIGIMQITNQSSYDQQRLKDDINYNIQTGVDILSKMYQRNDLPKIKEAGPEVIEYWYFPVMAYNGTKPVNSPLYQSDGTKNTNAYQEKVFAVLEQGSFLNDTKLGQFPFRTDDFEYQHTSDENIVFRKMEYTLTDQMHASTSLFQMGDNVVVTKDKVNLRSQPTSSSASSILAKSTTLIIEGNFVYDQSFTSENQFVWYPVKTADLKLAGYISSAYIMKKLDFPSVNPVDDNDVSLSGKAPANVSIQIMNGTTLIGNTVADANGYYKAVIPAQKAGTQLSVAYKDKLNTLSPATSIIVVDKTAPLAPIVNMVTNKSGELSGKTEANATIIVAIAGKAYSAKADVNGNYKVVIPIQNTGTTISVTAKDNAGNVGAARSVTVLRAAPNMPSVNTVNNKATTVTGKTEANATVTVAILVKTYSAKADVYGNYKVVLPVQNTGTMISVTAKDSAGHISAASSATFIRVAPNMPTVNTVRSYSTTVTGKTEKYVAVSIKIGKKTYTAKANAFGDYKVYIPKQRAVTKLYVNAIDAKGQVSATRSVTVS
ncbi:Ig-like domain-containing protein [Neobacillus pocheonensis]|uniref:Ig-like domain-containing protein n=1 Tax=Neobacillus pocheonensis TaxID=363869 RepID=A0ABT0W9U9_9BACI|nr:Ig-like domain-containing protein [Neobacillus pocheonensis]